MSVLAMTHPRRACRLPEQKALHVLVIEDEAGIRESLEALLEREGHRVDLAEDGIEGVEKAIALRPQVALIDIALPRLDGFEAARRIRSALGPAITLIACTAYSEAEDHQQALDAGFDALRVKPIDPYQLLNWLQILRPTEE
jgi:CheY-like chemotaxis protein